MSPALAGRFLTTGPPEKSVFKNYLAPLGLECGLESARA